MPRSRMAVLAVPVLLCLAILWQTSQLYGSCKQPSEATSVEALQQYLLDTSQAVRKRSPEAANAMQQLAADLGDAGPRLAELQQRLDEAQGQLNASSAQGQASRRREDGLRAQLDKLQQQLEEQSQAPAAGAGTGAGPQLEEERLHLLEVAGLQCNAVRDQEHWADPVVWGYDHRASDAAECCAACNAYNAAVERGGTDKGRNGTRCNIWAYCANREACKERHGECWLKHESKPLPPPPALPPGAHASRGWLSGAIYPHDAQLAASNGSVLVLHTSLGDIRIKLLPSLAPASVRELRRMAALQAGGWTSCSNCRIYRPEPDFLVQGLFEAPGSYVAVPRHPSPQQPMTMPRGMACWAGGTGGPHWFVNLIDQSGFKDEHLCWGQVLDMALFDKIVALPRRDKKPGEMNELVEHIRFNVSITQ